MPSLVPLERATAWEPDAGADADAGRIDTSGLVIEAQPACNKWWLLGAAQSLNTALAPVIRQPAAALSSLCIEGYGLCLWLRHDQALLLADVAGPEMLPADLTKRLAAIGARVLDAGSRFQSVAIRGELSADLLGTGCSLDLRAGSFPPLRCAQTRIEDVPVILHRQAATRFQLLVERPLAPHLWLWLREAAREFTQENA